MLILLASDGNNLESTIAKRFGHADYYIIFNTETEDFKVFENNKERHSHDSLWVFLDKGIKVFIVGNIGPYAFEIINTSKTVVCLARKMLIREAIEKFLKGELKRLYEPTLKNSIEHRHS